MHLIEARHDCDMEDPVLPYPQPGGQVVFHEGPHHLLRRLNPKILEMKNGIKVKWTVNH